MPQTLDDLAHDLRAAVLASDHPAATHLTVQYTEAVCRRWTLLTAQERSASPLPKQSLDLLTWVREMTLLQQGLTARHLAVASRYQNARAVYLRSSGDARP